jgi:hypothetical protein
MAVAPGKYAWKLPASRFVAVGYQRWIINVRRAVGSFEKGSDRFKSVHS